MKPIHLYLQKVGDTICHNLNYNISGRFVAVLLFIMRIQKHTGGENVPRDRERKEIIIYQGG